jgi:hypothetical protein
MLERLVAVWRDPESLANEVPILDASAERGMFTLGQAEHAVGLSEAVLLLVGEGMLVQTVPLVRMTLECAVTAAWLLVTPESGPAAFKQFARGRANLDIAMEDLADPAGRVDREKARDAEKARATMKAKAAGKKAPRKLTNIEEEGKDFWRRCAALDGNDWAYTYYRLLSEYSHGGAALLEHYGRAVDPTPDNPLGLEYDPAREFEYVEYVLGVQATSLVMVLTAWDDLAPGHALRDRLAEIADNMGAVVKFRRSDVDTAK